MSREPLSVRLACAVYDVALRCWPPGIRASLGVEVSHAFRLASRAAFDERGALNVARVTFLAVFDVFRSAVAEWRRSVRTRTAGPFSKPHRQRGTAPLSSRRMTLGTVLRELKLSTRFLRRNLGYSAVIMVTLAIGIGANTTVFSLVEGVLFGQATIPEAERLITIGEVNPNIDIPPRWVSMPNYLDWRSDVRSFGSLAMFRGRSMSVTGTGRPVYVYGSFVTSDFFQAMGVAPSFGRAISEEESTTNAPVVVIGHDLWQNVAGNDSSIVGQSISIDGITRTVVGVMPPGFVSPGPWIGPGTRVTLWIPFTSDDDRRVNRSFHVVGRLADEVTLDDARVEMQLEAKRLRDAYPVANAEWELVLNRWTDIVVGEARPLLIVAWVSAGFVLLIACVNVAGLTLNRTMARRSEMAVRSALGAGRRDLYLPLVVETMVLSVAGGVLGIGLAFVSVRVVKSLNPGVIPLMDRVGLNPTVLLVTGVTVLVVGLVVSFISIVQLVRNAPLSNGPMVDRRYTSSSRWLTHALTTLQLSLTFILLIGEGLMARTLVALGSVDPGFQTANVYQATVALSWNRVTTLPERTQFVSGVLERIRSLPGVESAGMINSLPLSGSNAWQPVWMPGEPTLPAEEQPVVTQRNVSPEYFRTMGIPILEGRDFRESDMESPLVAIVNRAMAERFWRGNSPVGRRIAVNDAQDTLTVVGVVGNVRHFGFRDEAPDEMYQVYARDFLTSKSFVLRTSRNGNLATIGDQVRDAVWAEDSEQPIRDAGPMDLMARNANGSERFVVSLLGAASVMAVLLAGVGVFGVMTTLVLERRRELAVRLALGSTRWHVVTRVLANGLRLAAVACLIGLIGSVFANRMLGHLLFEVGPQDATTYALVVFGICTLTALACLLPARRAANTPVAEMLDQM